MIKLTFEVASVKAEELAQSMLERTSERDAGDSRGDPSLLEISDLSEGTQKFLVQLYKEKLLQSWQKSGVIENTGIQTVFRPY